MDFNDTKEEAEFRAEARSWLDANAVLRKSGDSSMGMLEEGEGEGESIVKRSQTW